MTETALRPRNLSCVPCVSSRMRIRRLVLLVPLVFALPAAAGEIRGRLLVSNGNDRPAAGVTVSAVPWETPGEEARREAKADMEA